MKVLVLLALVACATAQTQWWPYSTPAATVKSADITSSIIPYAGVPWTQGVFPYNYPIVTAANPAIRAKRSADAEADPQMPYSSAVGYPYAGYPWAYNTYPYTWPYGINPIVNPVKPAEAARAKRSADAEPEADPQLISSSAATYPYAGYPWTYNTYPYTWPYGINPIVNPVKPAEAARAKRSADAEPEADPQLIPSSAATYPYAGYPWTYNTYPYTWPYGINPIVNPVKPAEAARAKRSADADADPQLIVNTPASYPFGAYPYSYNIDAGSGFINPYSGIYSYSTPVVTNTKVQLQ